MILAMCGQHPRQTQRQRHTQDKYKDKDESAENLNICYIFEKLRIQGYQI